MTAENDAPKKTANGALEALKSRFQAWTPSARKRPSKARLADLREVSRKAWQEARENLESAWDGLGKGVESAAERVRKRLG